MFSSHLYKLNKEDLMNKKILSATFFALAVSMVSAPVLASEAKQAGSGPNPFSDCGIGAALFPTVKWAAVTSNVIWDVGTTALTSATASPETCSGKTIETAMFILDTYDSLIVEAAKGSGEHTATTLTLMGCKNEDQAAASGELRKSVEHAINDVNYTSQSRVEKASGYYSALDQVVTANCSIVQS